MRDRAQTVIIGAGIVGVSAAYHLTELGVTDVLVLEQGPLFETGGSTSHAPGIIFQTNGSRTMCRIAQDSVALYDSLDLDGERVWYGVGGLEVATTVERMQELKRRQGFARSYGLEGTELLSPAEAAERSPLLDPSIDPRRVLGAERRRGQRREDRRGARAEGTGRRRRVRGRGHRHRVRHPRGSGAAACRPIAARWSANACCSAPASGDRRSARSPACRSRSWRCSTSSCGPTRSPSWPAWTATPGRGSRCSATRTCRCTSASAMTTSASGNYRHEPIVTPQARHPSTRRLDAAVADAVHPRGLRPVRDGGRAACSRRSPVTCVRATRLAR